VRGALLLVALAAACGPPDVPGPTLPDDDEISTFRPGATAEALLPAIDRGLQTPGKGPEHARFVILRAGDRHGASFRQASFHVTVGAGLRFPDGALLVRKHWGTAGMIDGRNEQPERYGIAVAVEPGAPQPFSAAVTAAVTTFCTALVRRVPIHPDCVLAMGEVPYTHPHPAALAEKALAAAARRDLPVPPADGALTLRTADRAIEVTFERRTTTVGIEVGMMLRRRFDGQDRGMLFEYPHRADRYFWTKNCRIPIDLAYIKGGHIEQIETMTPGAGRDQRDLPRYDSRTPVKYALEMPGGWFEKNGVEVGDKVEFD
jgi:uncharacterized membrane protein (UPF0127 family)